VRNYQVSMYQSLPPQIQNIRDNTKKILKRSIISPQLGNIYFTKVMNVDARAGKISINLVDRKFIIFSQKIFEQKKALNFLIEFNS